MKKLGVASALGRTVIVAGLLACALATTLMGQRGAGASCDPACLTSVADTYLAALVAHNPSKAPMAPNARFTEQAQVVPVGDGLWKTATEGPSTFKIAVPDPVAGQIGLLLMMKSSLPAQEGRGGAPGIPAGPGAIQLALRLKVENRQITEAEHIIARITAPSSLATLQAPRPPFFATVPAGERLPRSLMA